MPTTNPNILFKLSGITQGVYTFEQNPETYDIFAPKQRANVLPTIIGEDIYQRALLDNEVREMTWGEANYSLYTGLKNYVERDPNGNIITSYFWDGTVNEFQGAAIDLLDVYGQPIKGNFNKWSIKLQFKPKTNFDYEWIIV